ncbi:MULTISPECIES: hypothetical protein [unclassified Streptomyces]|uniref:hypothetical protein n=1 Tax=unclassified Streptomyces TaxID=2593676 RepID=UPI00341D1B7E
MSVTEQSAPVYRNLLGPEWGAGQEAVVLEHHSAADLDRGQLPDGLTHGQRAEAGEQARGAKLAAENWDAPFVLTTTVRLFESLFAHKPSAMRWLHRLAGSVIVLDEVQALPDRLLAPILSALHGLVEHFDVMVLLASATQPSFSRRFGTPAVGPVAVQGASNTLMLTAGPPGIGESEAIAYSQERIRFMGRVRYFEGAIQASRR